jgi:DNA-binding response OmpR family regulator
MDGGTRCNPIPPSRAVGEESLKSGEAPVKIVHERGIRGHAPANAYQAADMLIDVRVQRVTRGGVDLEVADRSFDLLLALVRAAPNRVSTQELMDSVWSGVIVGPETITQRIKLLRRSLGDSAENPVTLLQCGDMAIA